MGKIEDLAARYEEHILVPWPRTLAGSQRVILVVYEKELERAFRSRKAEFEQRTSSAGHGWVEYDCTSRFAEWMAREDYRDAYFEVPEDLRLKIETEFLEFVAAPLRQLLRDSDERSVVAVTGVASLFGFARVSDLLHTVEQDIRGRLVVFFPGTKDGERYRLLDARDGWNYLASCVTMHGTGEKA
ncbi:MAG: BREX protein BrxB domain-containing protein [Planctomycetota bacterium]